MARRAKAEPTFLDDPEAVAEDAERLEEIEEISEEDLERDEREEHPEEPREAVADRSGQQPVTPAEVTRISVELGQACEALQVIAEDIGAVWGQISDIRQSLRARGFTLG